MTKNWKVRKGAHGGLSIIDADIGQRVAKIDKGWGVTDARRIADLIASAPEMERRLAVQA